MLGSSYEAYGETHTLWLFNIAMENGPFIVDLPIKTTIYRGFSMAMLNNQMVHLISWNHIPPHLNTRYRSGDLPKQALRIHWNTDRGGSSRGPGDSSKISISNLNIYKKTTIFYGDKDMNIYEL